MQNRYVGDVADFGKHGLLRFLSGMTDPEGPEPNQKLKLGLVWYMHHDENHPTTNKVKMSGDGEQTGYLIRTPTDDRTNYRNCDPVLWEKLRDLVFRDARCVHCAEGAGILPDKTGYFNATLQFPPHMRSTERRDARASWMTAALQATKDADIVCVDPDNGIADDAGMYHKKGPKYVYVSDLKGFWERGQSLVVYHHLGMVKGGADVMIPAAAAKIREGLGVEPIPLWFHRGAARVFFVVPHPESEHGGAVRARANRFSEGLWAEKGHFERVWTTPEDGVSL